MALRLAEAPAPAAAGEAAGSGSAAVPSKGCGVTNGAKTLTTGGMSVASGLPTSTRLKITSGGMSREYIIDIPADYDPTHPYRLIFSWHQAYGSDTGNATGLYPAFDGPNFDATRLCLFRAPPRSDRGERSRHLRSARRESATCHGISRETVSSSTTCSPSSTRTCASTTAGSFPRASASER